MLTFALSKGRLADKIFKYLKELNLCDIKLLDDDRRLVLESSDQKFRFFFCLFISLTLRENYCRKNYNIYD